MGEGVKIECSVDNNEFIIDTSKDNPWKDLPVVQDCKPPTESPTFKPTEAPTFKPTKAPTLKPTKAPRRKKTPKPKKPRQLVSSETPDVGSAEILLIDPMKNLEEALLGATKEDENTD